MERVHGEPGDDVQSCKHLNLEGDNDMEYFLEWWIDHAQRNDSCEWRGHFIERQLSRTARRDASHWFWACLITRRSNLAHAHSLECSEARVLWDCPGLARTAYAGQVGVLRHKHCCASPLPSRLGKLGSLVATVHCPQLSFAL
eukprot:593670-Amphidinium_carterae.1